MAKDSYKVEHLSKMLSHEINSEEEHYGAHLTHWAGDSNPLTIDAGGIRALIAYYSHEGGTKAGVLFDAVVSILPTYPPAGEPDDPEYAWTDGDKILCWSEQSAEDIANAMECLGAEGIVTGYYDPEDDSVSGEFDEYTGWYYVSVV